MRLLALPLLLLAGALPAQTLTYAPGMARYRLSSSIKRTQHGPGNQTSELDIESRQLLRVNLTPAGRDSLAFDIRLDSISLASTPQLQLPDVSVLTGTTVTGTMSRSGKVAHYKSTVPHGDSLVDAKTFITGLTTFLVPLPPGAHVGSSWVDTTKNDTRQGGNDISSTTITTSTILADTTYGGRRAWRVRRLGALTLSGRQSQMGAQVLVDGKGTSSGVYYVGFDGRYLGAKTSQHMDMTTSIPARSLTIPTTQTVDSKVELIGKP